MSTLKPVLDAAIAADNDVKRILNEMDIAFNEGTEDGKQKALELRPALDEAKTKAEKANQLYVSMRDASLVSDNAAPLFVPPPDPATQEPKDASPKALSLPEFKALTPAAQMKFVKRGGKVTE